MRASGHPFTLALFSGTLRRTAIFVETAPGWSYSLPISLCLVALITFDHSPLDSTGRALYLPHLEPAAIALSRSFSHC
jgi:hypothetical protein